MTLEKITATSVSLIILAAGVVLGFAVDREDASPTTVAGPPARVTVTETLVRKTATPRARSGRRVFFRAGCSRCHTLGRPSETKVNLDELDPTYEVVVEVVTSGGIVMPSYRNRLSRQEIRNVAAFVERATE